MIGLLMRCGHDIRVDPDKGASPACWCGETRVARTLGAPPPRIVGHARGPGVESTFLGPKEDLNLAPAGPLTLKPDDFEEDD